MPKRFLLLISTLFCLLLPLSACSTTKLKQPEVMLRDIKATNTGLNMTLAVTLYVENPNNTPLYAQGGNMTLTVAGQKIATGVTNQPFNIAPLSGSELVFTVQTSPFSWLSAISALSNTKTEALEYELSGVLYGAQGWPLLPYKKTGRYALPLRLK